MSITILLIGAFVTFFILNIILNYKIKSGLLIIWLTVILIFYSDIYYFLKDIAFIESILRHRYLVALLAISWVLLFLFIRKSSKNFTPLNHYLNVLTALFFTIELAFVIHNHFTERQWKDFISIEDKNPKIDTAAIAGKATSEHPSVYFILLDAYINSNSLKKHWGFDNSEFLSSLKGNGFHIVEHAKSNYDATIYSMPSMLNMDYLPDLSHITNEITINTICRAWLKRSAVTAEFKKAGYEFINLSFFDIHEQPSTIEFDDLMLHGLSFYKHLFKKTMPGRIMADTYHTTLKPNRAVSMVEKAGELAETHHDNPLFVYSHALMPHRPYYFDGEGILYENGLGKYPDDEQKSYLEHLKYGNKITLETVERILKAEPDATIIIQGDHGAQIFEKEEDNRLEVYNTFCAIRFASGNYQNIPEDMTPVNLFRIVLNENTGKNYPMLEDKQELWTVNQHFDS